MTIREQLREATDRYISEQAILDESFESILAKAKKGLLTTAMMSAIFTSDAFSHDEKKTIRDAAQKTDVASPVTSDIISSTAMNGLNVIKSCLNLEGPISSLDQKALDNARYNVQKMGDTIASEIQSRLSQEEIKDIQTQLRFLRGNNKLYKTDKPDDVIRPNGKMDKATMSAVINLFQELKKRGLSKDDGNAAYKKAPDVVKGKFPTI